MKNQLARTGSDGSASEEQTPLTPHTLFDYLEAARAADATEQALVSVEDTLVSGADAALESAIQDALDTAPLVRAPVPTPPWPSLDLSAELAPEASASEFDAAATAQAEAEVPTAEAEAETTEAMVSARR